MPIIVTCLIVTCLLLACCRALFWIMWVRELWDNYAHVYFRLVQCFFTCQSPSIIIYHCLWLYRKHTLYIIHVSWSLQTHYILLSISSAVVDPVRLPAHFGGLLKSGRECDRRKNEKKMREIKHVKRRREREGVGEWRKTKHYHLYIRQELTYWMDGSPTPSYRYNACIN